MKRLNSLLLLFFGFGVLAFGQTANCSWTDPVFSSATPGPFHPNRATTTGGTPCVGFVVTYSTTGATGVSVQIEGSAVDTAGQPTGGYTSLSVQAGITGNANPAVGTAEGFIVACCDFYPAIRINPTTFNGTNQKMTVRVYGYVNTLATRGISSGAGGITQLTGDVNAGPGAGAQAATVVGVNGAAVPLSAPVVGTNAARQIVAANAANVVALFGVCVGSQYLGADGACHSVSTGGATGLTVWFNHPTVPFQLPQVTGTFSVTNNGTTATITCAACNFTTLGFQADMIVAASGFSNAANNSTNAEWSIKTVAATVLTLRSVAATGCSVGQGCTPAVLAMVAEGPTAAVTLQIHREGATSFPPTTAQSDEFMRIDAADGATPMDSYITDLGVPNTITIPAGDWTFDDWAYRSGGGGVTEYFQVAKVSTTGVETALFDTSLSATSITATNASPPQHVQQVYTLVSPIAILTSDRIIIRTVFTVAAGTRVVHHVYQGSTFAGFVITSFPVLCSNCVPYTGATSDVNLGTHTLTSGPQNFCADATGSTTDYTCSISPAITSYVTGTTYRFTAQAANTAAGGKPTINLNGVGAKQIVKVQGGITTALVTNDIRAGQAVVMVYDGTNMQMVSELGNAAAAGSIAVTTDALKGDGAGNAVAVTGTGTNCVHVDGTSAACGGATPGLVLVEQHGDYSTPVNDLFFTTGITSTYDEYVIEAVDILPGTAKQFYFRVSTDGGGTYDSTSGHYKDVVIANVTSLGASTSSMWNWSANNDETLLANTTWNGTWHLYNPLGGVNFTQFRGEYNMQQSAGSGTPFHWQSGGYYAQTTAVNAFKVSGCIASCASAGTFTGVVRLYGLAK